MEKKIYVVGIGPGALEDMTIRAKKHWSRARSSQVIRYMWI